MQESLLLTAFLVGIFGGVHCLGMCGGVVGTLTLGLSVKHQQSWWRMLPFQLLYNLGRISSYAVIGTLFGLLGMAIGGLDAFLPIQQGLQVFAGVFMIALGLYLAGWWFGIVSIEKAGQVIWQKFQPMVQRLTPVENYRQAYTYGLVWGWLPCGLVYSMLIMALTAGSMLDGALVMLAFGLGTLPNLLLMGVFAFYFTRFTRNIWVKKAAGVSVIALGLWQIYLAFTVAV